MFPLILSVLNRDLGIIIGGGGGGGGTVISIKEC